MTLSYTVRLRAVFLALVTFALATTSLMAQWSDLPALPTPLSFSQQAVVDNKLYVFGGLNTQGRATNAAMVLDLANPTAGWVPIAPMPESRGAGAAIAYNGKIYLVSGVGTDVGVTGRGTVVIYDPATNEYSASATVMVAPSFYSGVTLAGTKIYVMGGLVRSGTQNMPIQLTQVYDITTDSWTTGPALPNVYYYGSAATIGTDVYFFGGRFQNQVGEYYNGTGVKLANGTGSWAAFTKPLYVHSEFGSAGAFDGNIYFAGGTSLGRVTDVTQVMDASGTWTPYYSMPVASQAGGGLAVGDDGLYYVGGSAGRVMKLSIGEAKAIAGVTPTSLSISAPIGGTSAKPISITNTGIIDLEGTVEVAPGTPWLTASPATFSVAPLEREKVTLTVDASSLAAGRHTATVNVRTNDLDNEVTSITVTVRVVEGLVVQPVKIVVEEATGAWCGPCGAVGGPTMKEMQSLFGDQLISIALHDRNGYGDAADPMGTNATEQLNEKLGVPYFPSAAVQRIDWPEEAGRMTGTDTWQRHIEEVIESTPMAPIAVEVVSYSFNPATQKVNANLRLTSAEDIVFPSGTTLRVTGVVTEDGIEHAQAGAAEDPFFHDHVARHFWPNNSGQAIQMPTGAVVDEMITPGTIFTVNASFDVENVADPEQAHIVWLVHVNSGNTLGPILQAAEHELTATIGSGSAPVVAVTADVATKSIGVGETATFNTAVMNLTGSALSVTVDRETNTMPTAEWTSRLGVDGTYVPATTNSVVHTIQAGETAVFNVEITGATATAQGVVGLAIRANDTTITQTYTAATGTSGIGSETGLDAGMSLTVYPNPMTATGRFEFTVPTSGTATLGLFAASGEKVRSLLDGSVTAGRNSVAVDFSTVPAGVYTVVLTSNGRTSARSITVVR